MPRHTRTRTLRRQEAFVQAQRDKQARFLAAELRRLWRQYERAALTDDMASYRDPELAARAWEAA